jgi:hypothetical protein
LVVRHLTFDHRQRSTQIETLYPAKLVTRLPDVQKLVDHSSKVSEATAPSCAHSTRQSPALRNKYMNSVCSKCPRFRSWSAAHNYHFRVVESGWAGWVADKSLVEMLQLNTVILRLH